MKMESSVAFLGPQDGQYIVTQSNEFEITLWSSETQEAAVKIYEECECLFQVTPDCTKLVAASIDGNIRVWNILTGQLMSEIVQADWDETQFISVHNEYVAVSFPSSVQVFHLGDGSKVWFTPFTIYACWSAFSSSALFIEPGFTKNKVTIRNLVTREEATLEGHSHPPMYVVRASRIKVALDGDGAGEAVSEMNRFASATNRCPEILVWDMIDSPHQGFQATTASLCVKHTIKLPVNEWILHINFNHDGSRLVCSVVNQQVKVWNVENDHNAELISVLAIRAGSCAFVSTRLPNQIVCGAGRSVDIYDIESKEKVSSLGSNNLTGRVVTTFANETVVLM